MYILIEKMHKIQHHGIFFEIKVFNLLKKGIRNSSQKIGALVCYFWGFCCQDDGETPCWLRPCNYGTVKSCDGLISLQEIVSRCV